jgi:hypothetical protein
MPSFSTTSFATPRANRRSIMRTVTTAAELNLTDQQKRAIAQSVQAEKGQSAPVGFMPRIGSSVPQSLSRRQLPSNITTQVPAAKNLEYTKFDNNEVLLIDPSDMRVAEIMTPSGTTGAAPCRLPRRDKASIGSRMRRGATVASGGNTRSTIGAVCRHINFSSIFETQQPKLVHRFLETNHMKGAYHEGNTHRHRSFDMTRTSETLY